jgi:uncharacterized protein (TIGR02302 family)
MSERRSTPERIFHARLRLAGLALLWERMWPACWPAFGVAAVFAVLALFDLLPLLPGPAHSAVLVVLAALFALALYIGCRGLVVPDQAAARRRIELSSGLAHRPLAALADRPSTPLDAGARRLWEAHRRRMANAARRLRIGWPMAGLARHDPWGLRSLLAIALLLGAIDAGADWRDRIVRAATPSLSFGAPIAPGILQIWVTPPDYTGLPPRFLKSGATRPIAIPTGSSLLAQVHGGDGVPALAIGDKTHDFTAVDKTDFQTSTKLTEGNRLAVTQNGQTLGSWPIQIIPDLPPRIAFPRPPSATPRAALRLDYEASDDYGIEGVKAVIRREGGKADEQIVLQLPLPGLHLKKAQASSYHDLAAHPWAGLPVVIRLVATDGLNQTGESESVRTVLPERIFHNPVARALVEQRRELVKNPDSRMAVAEIVGDLRHEHALYNDDAVAYLGMRMAEEVLRLDRRAEALASVEKLLWDTALRIEDGNLSLAEQTLRRLEQQLQDALARNAPDAEIDRLMRQLQQALDRYLQALAQQLRRNPNSALEMPRGGRVVSSQDLQRMLERAREMARSGMRAQARQLLSQLENMLENLRLAQPTLQQRQQQAEAQRMMRSMQDMMRRQQQLLDQSFRAQRNGEYGGNGMMSGHMPRQQDMSGAAGEQEGLRRALGDIMRRLGENSGGIPEPFGRAERAMRGAVGALQRNLPGAAIGPQTEALDQLQQAARDLAQQMQRQFGGQPNGEGMDVTGQQPTGRFGRDPLGRPLSNGGAFDEGDVKIPDNTTLRKARDILDELRRRSGDRDRPQIELRYLDRLLQQF